MWKLFSGVINRLLARDCFTERPQALGLTWKWLEDEGTGLSVSLTSPPSHAWAAPDSWNLACLSLPPYPGPRPLGLH